MVDKKTGIDNVIDFAIIFYNYMKDKTLAF